MGFEPRSVPCVPISLLRAPSSLSQRTLEETGFELGFDNIIALASDVPLLKAALKTLNCKGKPRPQLAAPRDPFPSAAASSSTAPVAPHDALKLDDQPQDPCDSDE